MPALNRARRLQVALLLALALPVAVQAQAPPSEDAVKAAYLYKLRNYVQFPPGAGQPPQVPTVIAVVGAPEVADHLERMLALRASGAGPVVLRRLRVGDALAGVHIVFVGHDAWRRAADMVAQAGRSSVLVVSDADHALQGGSVINFLLVDERIRFEISLDAAEKSHLKLSSQLLSLAQSVVRDKRK